MADHVRIPNRVRHDEDGWNVADGVTSWPIIIDPDLPVRGQVNRPAYGECSISLREWDERVLLHEVLHVLVDRVLPDDGNHRHDLVALIEVGVLTAGFQHRAALRPYPSETP